jgi:2-oxo-4-hydroxy-4-carboxy--5-ureidoimidazoline (OHCU) decarboxylase
MRTKESINSMSFQDKIVTVNAHPRIGAPLQTLSDLSKLEQSAGSSEPGLERTLKKLSELNSKYIKKLGSRVIQSDK